MIEQVAAVVKEVAKETVEIAKTADALKKTVDKVTSEKDADWGSGVLKHEVKAGIKAGSEKLSENLNKYLNKLEGKEELSEGEVQAVEGKAIAETDIDIGDVSSSEHTGDSLELSLERYLDRLETPAEKIGKQEESIEKVENGEKTLDSAQEKGNYGEMKTDQDLRDMGYERISEDMVTDVDDPGHRGIDGVYYNPDGTPQYVIVDSKYGTAQLTDTMDGKQMSDNWIDKRLDESVGKERADDIRMEKLLNPDNVGSYVAHVDENGTVSFDKLDGDANTIERDVKINE